LADKLGHSDAQRLLAGTMARLAYNGHEGFPVPAGYPRSSPTWSTTLSVP
jgi:hypothetical protein